MILRDWSAQWAAAGQLGDENQTEAKYVESILIAYLDESSILSDSTKKVSIRLLVEIFFIP